MHASGTLLMLMFADAFAGVASSAAQLQADVAAAWAWCDRWRMQANVGPAWGLGGPL
jgi:hypothetical protein